MKVLDSFEIAFVGLSHGKHTFEFELNDDFFACFEGSEIVRSNAAGTMVMHKKNNMFDLEFFIRGNVELRCDRCLEKFWQPLDIHRVLYVKFGDVFEEQSDEVIIIPQTESHINVSQYFYEFAMLHLPLKRVHGEEGDNEGQCDPEVLKELEKYMVDSSGNRKTGEKDKPTDARWDALKNLKFN